MHWVGHACQSFDNPGTVIGSQLLLPMLQVGCSVVG